MKINHWWLKTKMAAKIAAVDGIETGFRHITNSIWGWEKCNVCFYPRKIQAINIWPFYTDDINSWWLKTKMAAKIAAVVGIETRFRHITKSVRSRERCNICFFTLERAKELIYVRLYQNSSNFPHLVIYVTPHHNFHKSYNVIQWSNVKNFHMCMSQVMRRMSIYTVMMIAYCQMRQLHKEMIF